MTLVLKDFCKGNMFDMFAIEYEVNKSTSNELHSQYDIDFYEESPEIFEVQNLHKESSLRIETVIDYVEKKFKKAKPIGSDRMLSGGRHAHIFLGEIMLRRVAEMSAKKLYHKVINSGLHLSYLNINGATVVKGRHLARRAGEPDSSSFRTDTKDHGVSLKESYHSHSNNDFDCRSIEFRMNDVIDYRIITLYQAVLLATDQNVLLKRVSPGAKEYFMTGSPTYFHDRNRHNDPIIPLSDIKIPGYILSMEDKRNIKTNHRRLHKVLLDNGLTNSAKLFLEYFQEEVLATF